MPRHLYIAYSNLHLLFAQAIALGQKRDDLKDLWLGAQYEGSPLEQLYQRMIVRNLWHKVLPLTLHRSLSLPGGRTMAQHPFDSIGRWRSAVKELRAQNIASQYDELWVAHPFDPLCRLLAEEMHRQGKKVHFYEEGLSVYLLRDVSAKKTTWSGRFSAFTRNLIARVYRADALLRPLSDYLTDAWLMLPDTPSIFPSGLSIVDLKSRFDRKYIEAAIQGSSMAEIIPNAASCYPRESFLLLLCSVEIEDHWFAAPQYLAALRAYLRNFQSKARVIAVKPHPRSEKDVFVRVLEIIRELGFRCEIIEEGFPMPIEFLLPAINCVAVVGGISSPLIYLRQLYAVPTYSIVPTIDPRGLPWQSVAYIEVAKKIFISREIGQP